LKKILLQLWIQFAGRREYEWQTVTRRKRRRSWNPRSFEIPWVSGLWNGT